MSNSLKVKVVHFRNPDEIYIKFLEGDKSRNNVVNARKINKVQDKLAYLCENASKTNNPELGEVIIIINLVFIEIPHVISQITKPRFMDVISALGRNGFVEKSSLCKVLMDIRSSALIMVTTKQMSYNL